jgi:phosphate acetyltransferase
VPTRSGTAETAAIYIAAPEPASGKATIALGLLHRLAARVAKVGVFRPITRVSGGDPLRPASPRLRSPRLGEDRDYILELLLEHTTAGLPYEQCVGVTYQQLHADTDAAITDIVTSYHEMAGACDAVVIVGSDYTDVPTPTELSVNARIAVNLGAPVLLAVSAKGRSADQVASVVAVCLAELSAQHAHTAAVVANRCAPAELAAVS